MGELLAIRFLLLSSNPLYSNSPILNTCLAPCEFRTLDIYRQATLMDTNTLPQNQNITITFTIPTPTSLQEYYQKLQIVIINGTTCQGNITNISIQPLLWAGSSYTGSISNLTIFFISPSSQGHITLCYNNSNSSTYSKIETYYIGPSVVNGGKGGIIWWDFWFAVAICSATMFLAYCIICWIIIFCCKKKKPKPVVRQLEKYEITFTAPDKEDNDVTPLDDMTSGLELPEYPNKHVSYPEDESNYSTSPRSPLTYTRILETKLAIHQQIAQKKQELDDIIYSRNQQEHQSELQKDYEMKEETNPQNAENESITSGTRLPSPITQDTNQHSKNTETQTYSNHKYTETDATLEEPTNPNLSSILNEPVSQPFQLPSMPQSIPLPTLPALSQLRPYDLNHYIPQPFMEPFIEEQPQMDNMIANNGEFMDAMLNWIIQNNPQSHLNPTYDTQTPEKDPSNPEPPILNPLNTIPGIISYPSPLPSPSNEQKKRQELRSKLAKYEKEVNRELDQIENRQTEKRPQKRSQKAKEKDKEREKREILEEVPSPPVRKAAYIVSRPWI
eukprot:NODE_482_length_2696_cov_6.469880_g413_i0.p1 GENE.NODE_482_length_2696_cov_6.469880_g413_i0~~NODE_482_length_2696_cov_6.469880_g413_i0.p1  ORF type:complete len:559 (-),score=105.00 NODE_482_length_2696_cov_6.469880_g413_i0:152-1828(-)